MLDHRVAGIAAEPALEAQQDRPRLRPLELELALPEIGLDAVEADQEIGLPGRPAVFAVGDRFEADVFLAADQLDDLLVLDGAQVGGADLTALMPAARRLERGGAQQAADMIGAERPRAFLHW